MARLSMASVTAHLNWVTRARCAKFLDALLNWKMWIALAMVNVSQPLLSVCVIQAGLVWAVSAQIVPAHRIVTIVVFAAMPSILLAALIALPVGWGQLAMSHASMARSHHLTVATVFVIQAGLVQAVTWNAVVMVKLSITPVVNAIAMTLKKATLGVACCAKSLVVQVTTETALATAIAIRRWVSALVSPAGWVSIAAYQLARVRHPVTARVFATALNNNATASRTTLEKLASYLACTVPGLRLKKAASAMIVTLASVAIPFVMTRVLVVVMVSASAM